MIISRLVKLPLSVKGVTVPDEEGNYNIFINKDLGYKIQQKTYLHEMTHIKNDDFRSVEPVFILEKKANHI